MTAHLPAPKKSSIYSDFDAAKEKLLTAIHRGPFYGLLVGESGTGKSSLLRRVAAICDRHRYNMLYLSGSQTTKSGLGRYLVDVLNLARRRSHAETLRALIQILRESPARLILLMDEAHQLPESTLQEARLLAESDLEPTALFSVVFAGTLDLKTKLDAAALFPLKRRISLRLELTGLKKDEVRPFVLARVDGGERLCEDLVAAIFERARGIPALIEDLATTCLHSVPGKDSIALGSVEEVLEAWEVR
jgi:type II secretory pathway predicted ATPase ExeA